jgi:hypothetical protein
MESSKVSPSGHARQRAERGARARARLRWQHYTAVWFGTDSIFPSMDPFQYFIISSAWFFSGSGGDEVLKWEMESWIFFSGAILELCGFMGLTRFLGV